MVWWLQELCAFPIRVQRDTVRSCGVLVVASTCTELDQCWHSRKEEIEKDLDFKGNISWKHNYWPSLRGLVQTGAEPYFSADG